MDYNDPAAVEAHRILDRLYARLVQRRPHFQTRTEYYQGKQPLNFATKEWQDANAQRYAGFSDNWTAPVAAAESERIHHTGLVLDPKSFGEASKVLFQQWQLNEMEMQSSQGWLASLVTSRTFVLVWGRPGSDDEPEITWETGSSVEIEYDWYNPRKRRAAVKTWVDEDFEYANLYDASYLWKYKRAIPAKKSDRESQAEQANVTAGSEGGFSPRIVDNEPWPLPNPMGEVPIVEMPNRPVLGGDPISEIAGTIAMQDAINLNWAYLFLAADYASMDARIITGTAPPKIPVLDSNGQVVGDKLVPMKELYEKRIAFFQGDNVKAQSWEKAELGGFLEVIETAVAHIAAQTRTPPTYLITKVGMSNVNAEGLKASEIGLVKKTIEFQRYISPALRELYRLIALAMGDKKLADAARLATIRWANPEIRSESQLADMLTKKKAVGYPFEYLMELDGIDPETMARILAMREQELRDPQIEAAMRELNDADDSSGAVSDTAGDRDDNGDRDREAVETADA